MPQGLIRTKEIAAAEKLEPLFCWEDTGTAAASAAFAMVVGHDALNPDGPRVVLTPCPEEGLISASVWQDGSEVTVTVKEVKPVPAVGGNKNQKEMRSLEEELDH